MFIAGEDWWKGRVFKLCLAENVFALMAFIATLAQYNGEQQRVVSRYKATQNTGHHSLFAIIARC